MIRLFIIFLVIFIRQGSVFSLESNSELFKTLTKLKVQKISKDGTIFSLNNLKYQITFGDAGQIGAVQVEKLDKQQALCISEVQSAAKSIVDQLHPLGSDLGRDQVEIIPTSGKRRYNHKFEKAVEVVSVFRQDRCDLFDRLTFFYWIFFEGKVKSKSIESVSDLTGRTLQRFFIIIDSKKLEFSENDFKNIETGNYIQIEYLMTNNLARIIPSK